MTSAAIQEIHGSFNPVITHIRKGVGVSFFIDVIIDDHAHYQKAMGSVKPLTKSVVVLGEYTEGEKCLAEDC